MQALVGVELLLDKAHVWEENASHHVSLSAELDGAARLVTRWRKLELASWPLLLNAARTQHEETANQAKKLTICFEASLCRGTGAQDLTGG